MIHRPCGLQDGHQSPVRHPCVDNVCDDGYLLAAVQDV